MAATRPGMIAGYSPPGLGGLPGMAGGSRRRRRSKRSKRSRRRQRGGRYTTEPGAPYASVGPNVFTPVSKLGCGFQGGGGGVDLAAYSAPTAGYTNQPSTWVGASGAPVLLQAPYDARTMNQACIKTGGGRRRARKSRMKRRGNKHMRSRKH